MNAERRGEQLPDTAPRRQADRSTWPPRLPKDCLVRINAFISPVIDCSQKQHGLLATPGAESGVEAPGHPSFLSAFGSAPCGLTASESWDRFWSPGVVTLCHQHLAKGTRTALGVTGSPQSWHEADRGAEAGASSSTHHTPHGTAGGAPWGPCQGQHRGGGQRSRRRAQPVFRLLPRRCRGR